MRAIAARHDRALRSTAEPSCQSPGRARMAHGDRVNLVVQQEPCHPGVMGTLGSLVMQRSPADRELLPAGDLDVDDAGDRDTIGAAPLPSTWPNQPFCKD